jgi:hypothetical protein
LKICNEEQHQKKDLGLHSSVHGGFEVVMLSSDEEKKGKKEQQVGRE